MGKFRVVSLLWEGRTREKDASVNVGRGQEGGRAAYALHVRMRPCCRCGAHTRCKQSHRESEGERRGRSSSPHERCLFLKRLLPEGRAQLFTAGTRSRRGFSAGTRDSQARLLLLTGWHPTMMAKKKKKKKKKKPRSACRRWQQCRASFSRQPRYRRACCCCSWCRSSSCSRVRRKP